MTRCKFVSSTEPRVISGRHQDPCRCDDRELGCLECTETHCVICSRNHARAACIDCLAAARDDLRAIADLCHALPAEAVEKGVQSEAMMLLAPAADPGEWNRTATAAIFEQVRLESAGEPVPVSLTAYLADCRDEMHPLFVLGSWEQVWRDFLDHQTDKRITVESAVSYLDMQIGYMSDQIDPPFDEFARELRQCRGHLEDVLRDGIREERGAPCVQCERPMVRTEDHWECRKCHRRVTEAEYRFAVGTAYIAHSPSLTAAEMHERTGVKASVIRVWGSRYPEIKRGRDHLGITLYDVASVIKRRDETETEKAG